MVRNEDILRDILLKMSYDTSKTLNENIQEQGSADRFVDMRAMGGAQGYANYKKQQWNPKPLTSDQKHLLMDIAAVGAFFIPVVGPALSLGIELANAGMYYAEGDEYGAGFALAFALIPMGELIGKIPAVEKLGRDGLASLIKKARRGGKLTKTESEIVEQISKNEKWLKISAAKQATKMFVKSKIQKAGLKDIVYAMYKYSKKHPTKFSLTKNGLMIGGIWYTYAQLADIYGIGQEQPELAVSEPMYDKTQIVTDFDKVWDYKKDGDKFYTKKKDSDKWILTSGKTKESIKTKVFSGKESNHKLTSQMKKIEQEYISDKENIDKLVLAQVTATIDTVKANQYWEDAFSDL